MTTIDRTESPAGASGGVRIMLRAEGVLALLACVMAYQGTGASWWWFAGTFFAPDLVMIAYAGGAAMGARAYNATHSYVAPLLLAVVAMSVGDTGSLFPATLVWGAHIGFDRALGYGLKYEAGFTHTHLGRIGRVPRPATITPKLEG